MFLFICLVALIFAVTGFVVAISEWLNNNNKSATVWLLIMLLGAGTIAWSVDRGNAKARASTDFTTIYGVVGGITNNSITITTSKDITFYGYSDYNKSYPLNTKEFKLGELVKVTYISGDFRNYVKSIEEIKVKE